MNEVWPGKTKGWLVNSRTEQGRGHPSKPKTPEGRCFIMIPVASPALNKEPGTKWMLKEYLLDLHLFKRLVGSCKFQSQDKSTEDSKARLAVKTATFQFLSKTTLGFNISGNCVILEQNDFTHISTREHQGIDLWNIRSLSKWQDQKLQFLNCRLQK